MRTRSRRKLDAGLLVGGGVVAGGVAAIGAFLGNTEHVQSMWVGATLAPDGSAAIEEVIDYDFGSTPDRHGIFRDVPGLDPGSRIVVTSPNAPDDLAVFPTPPDSPSYPATRLRIGSPSETVSREKRYVISYQLDDIAPGGQLAWDAIGAGWEVPIEQTEIQVAAPWELTDIRCDQGRTGDVGGCEAEQPEPGRLVVRTGRLEAREGVTVYASRGADLAAAPTLTPPTEAPDTDEGPSVPLVAAVGAGATLLGAAPASRLIRRAGRERVYIGGPADAAFGVGGAERRIDHEELAGLATIEFAPPEDLTPAQGGVVLREGVRQEHKVAWLIDEAIKGTVELIDRGSKQVSLRRGDQLPDPEAAPALDAIFDGRQQVDLGKYDKDFARGWALVGTQLQRWADTSGLWDPAGGRRRVLAGVLGAVGAVLGLGIVGAGAAIAASTANAWWLLAVVVGALLAGVSLAAAVRGWELRVRTPEGAARWLRVESFRRFLAESEAYHAEQAAARGVLREYTAWAVAVGELDRWSRAVENAVNIPDRTALTYVYLAPVLSSATSSSATAPSSSGGGGGGGGGVGGGGGGGGGGSW